MLLLCLIAQVDLNLLIFHCMGVMYLDKMGKIYRTCFLTPTKDVKLKFGTKHFVTMRSNINKAPLTQMVTLPSDFVQLY